MPQISKPLTDSQIKQAKPRAKEFKLSDGKGLFLRVRPSGSKDWKFRYKIPFTDKRTDMSFGAYPAVTLVKARNQRSEAQTLLADNIDPKEQKSTFMLEQKRLKSVTFESIMKDWLIVKGSKVSPDHATDIRRSLENHVMPDLGQRPINELKNIEIIQVLRPLEAAGKLEMVKRICQRINEIMIYCVNTGVLRHNSFAGVGTAFQAPVETNLPTIEPHGLPKLLKDLSMASVKVITRCLIEWQLHTMVRPSEAAGARWEEIDLDEKLWIIPAERMKKKNNGDHKVPLTDQTLDLLNFIKSMSGHREFLFPADRNPLNHTNPATANVALKRMGYHKKLVAHGLRSLASTTLNTQGHDPDVIEACLAHIDSNSVRRAYNRTDYLERRRKVMSWWSQHIADAASGSIAISSGTKTLRLVNQ
jgi:integrase